MNLLKRLFTKTNSTNSIRDKYNNSWSEFLGTKESRRLIEAGGFYEFFNGIDTAKLSIKEFENQINNKLISLRRDNPTLLRDNFLKLDNIRLRIFASLMYRNNQETENDFKERLQAEKFDLTKKQNLNIELLKERVNFIDGLNPISNTEALESWFREKHPELYSFWLFINDICKTFSRQYESNQGIVWGVARPKNCNYSWIPPSHENEIINWVPLCKHLTKNDRTDFQKTQAIKSEYFKSPNESSWKRSLTMSLLHLEDNKCYRDDNFLENFIYVYKAGQFDICMSYNMQIVKKMVHYDSFKSLYNGKIFLYNDFPTSAYIIIMKDLSELISSCYIFDKSDEI